MNIPSKLSELRDHYDNTDLSSEIAAAQWETDVDTDPMVTTSLRLPKSLLDWIRRQAADQHIKPTTMIRHWIEDRYLAEQKDDQDSTAARLERLEQVVFDHNKAG